MVLIGMMGSGKSTIGRALAQLSGWPYFDNDELLAVSRGATAKTILARKGEAELRENEANALRLGLQSRLRASSVRRRAPSSMNASATSFASKRWSFG